MSDYSSGTAEYLEGAHFQKDNVLIYQNKSIEEILLQFEPMVKKQILSLQVFKGQEEFYQIGLIGLWEAYQRFDPEKGPFPAFAQKTVRGRMLQHMKELARFEQRYTVVSDEVLEFIEDTGSGVLLEREIILSYCDGLSERQLAWVNHAIIENKKLREISKIEGVPANHIKSWRREALRKMLKNYLEIHRS